MRGSEGVPSCLPPALPETAHLCLLLHCLRPLQQGQASLMPCVPLTLCMLWVVPVVPTAHACDRHCLRPPPADSACRPWWMPCWRPPQLHSLPFGCPASACPACLSLPCQDPACVQPPGGCCSFFFLPAALTWTHHCLDPPFDCPPSGPIHHQSPCATGPALPLTQFSSLIPHGFDFFPLHHFYV